EHYVMLVCRNLTSYSHHASQIQQKQRAKHHPLAEQRMHATKGGQNALADCEYHRGQKSNGESMARCPANSIIFIEKRRRKREHGGHNQPNVCTANKIGKTRVNAIQLCRLNTPFKDVQ